MAKAFILNDLIDALDVNISKFERNIDVGSTTIRNAIKRNSEIKLDIVEKIVTAYPQVNKEWLLTGEGKMFIESAVSEGSSKEVIPLGKHVHTRLKPEDYKSAFEGWEGVPMYNTPITASFINSYRDDAVFIPQYYLFDPRFRDCDFGAIITGDSMHSEIRHGDFIACKEVIDKEFVVYGDIYYIVAKNGLETCKYLNADPASRDNFLLVPKNEKISPSPIKKGMIDKLYKVRGIIRGY